MKTFTVEVRATFEVRASSKEEALESVPITEDHETLQRVEYVVRECRAPATDAARPDERDSHGLSKPLYTVSEAAGVLGLSKSAMYEKTSSGAIQTVRLGKRSIRVPKAALARVLNGEGDLQPEEPQRAVRREIQRRHVSVLKPRERKKTTKQPARRGSALNPPEAGKRLGVTVARLREMLDRRQIYYVEIDNRRVIPKKALDAFINGMSPLEVVQQNIKDAKAAGGWSDDDQKAADALMKSWKPKRR